MENNSIGNLSEQLAQKRHQDLEETQKVALSVLKKHVRTLRDGLKDELNTTATDTSAQIDQIKGLIEKLESTVSRSSTATRKQLKNDLLEIEKVSAQNKAAALSTMKWGWLKYSLPALMVLAVILGGSWGAMRWMSQELMETRQEIQLAQQTLNQLPGAVRYLERSGNQYLLLETEPEVYQAESGSWVVKLKKP